MTWTEFWNMGGYAPYVWGSYGVTALLLAAEVAQLLSRKRAAHRRLREIGQMEVD